MNNTKVILSTLWIVVLFNMIFADILSFITTGFSEVSTMQVSQSLLLIYAILLEIPIIMVILSRVLKRGVNRWANIVASVITIAFVIGLGSNYLHYIFFATIEVVLMILIIGIAWKWEDNEEMLNLDK